jgi:hypothetical protein
VESFLTAVKENGKLLSISGPETSSAPSTSSAVPCPHHSCWDCQLSCGRVLIRTAALPPDDDDNDECRTTRTRSLVQVHRCSGCCVGTHVLRQKLFQYLQQQQHCGSSSREEPQRQDGRRVVPFDFLECTAAMRQDFQDRCRALLGSDRVDCQELAKQALLGQKQL